MQTHRHIYFPSNISERQSLASQLRPGDIVFQHRQLINGGAWIDVFEMIIQKLVSFFLREDIPEDCKNISHVSIVTSVNKETGEVFVADAMPTSKKKSALRNVPLFEHKDAVLRRGTDCWYSVLRAPERFSKQVVLAAQIAERVGVKPTYVRPVAECFSDKRNGPLRAQFSLWLGFKSILAGSEGSRSFDKKAKKKVFKQLYNHEVDDGLVLNGSKKTGRLFFCSYFVSYLLQRAEAVELAKEQKIDQQIRSFATTNNLDDANRFLAVSSWSENMLEQYGDSFFNKMIMNINAKKTAPQALKIFLRERDFCEVVQISAPS